MRSVIGDNIRRRRRAKDMTVEQLATLIGSKREYVTKLENRTPKNPSLEKLQAIADVFGITVSELCQPFKTSKSHITSDQRDQLFIQKYLKLDTNHKKHIQKIIDTYS